MPTANRKKFLTLQDYWKARAEQVERALEERLPRAEEYPGKIHAAMRYAVLGGGKRFRPLLVLAVSDMLGGETEEAMTAACAIELIHAYSLVHDDLPCMDNDDFRRGKPSCHKQYGEAIALLAGDALLTHAFYLLSTMKHAKTSAALAREISRSAGSFGMVGGQVVDLETAAGEIDPAKMDYIHIHKTGQLIRASCLAGALVARAGKIATDKVIRYGEYLGFAFQIVDDILDENGYLRLMSAMEAREKAADLIENAKASIAGFPGSDRLLQIAEFVLNRKG